MSLSYSVVWALTARAAGIQLLDSDPSKAGAIWYPCAAEPQSGPLGGLAVPFSDPLRGVKDCPVTGTKLPLVIVSHGRGGWFGFHHDVEEALVDAGFVVAAINHPGDTANDSSQRTAGSEEKSSSLPRPLTLGHCGRLGYSERRPIGRKPCDDWRSRSTM
jgi:predicted dienelactone hydrolase